MAGVVLGCTLSLGVAQDTATEVAANAPEAGAGPQPAVPEFNPKPADGAQSSGEFRALDADVQDLKKQVLDLNKDLFLLEEELLFPSNTQVAVFVSMDVGDFFGLDSVELKIDNKNVTNYLYTEREASALVKGGVQRVFVGNLKAGQHELVAVFTGEVRTRATIDAARRSSSRRESARNTSSSRSRTASRRCSRSSSSRSGSSRCCRA